jgi:carbonic anhydrase/acetyltransferase-like protein (isoleucine patch superfamily)
MADARNLLTFNGVTPRVAAGAWVADEAILIGDVTVADGASVFYRAVLRGDMDSISIGAGTNVQDGVVIHADPGTPVVLGAGISVGHSAVLHGCTVRDDCLIGMSATVLNGAVIGHGSLIAAGAVVLEGTEIPPGSLVAGVPAKVRRSLTESEHDSIALNAAAYRDLAKAHAALRG